MVHVAALPAYATIRQVRRRAGSWHLRRVSVSGATPTIVVNALKLANQGRPSAAELAWIDRIESVRASYLASQDLLEVEDFGSGRIASAQANHVTARTLGSMTRSSKPPRWAYLLFRLAREFQPQACVELGACVGISAAYQAAALELNGQQGRLVSLEGAEVLAARSTRTLESLGLQSRASVRVGRFSDTLGPTLADLSPVDWVFLDGHHDEKATLDYMEQILPSLANDAILIFDDINWSDGMRRAWKQVVADPRFALTVDLRSVGLAIVSSDALERETLNIAYG
jgi:predicted O-methyltransferase YrrM